MESLTVPPLESSATLDKESSSPYRRRRGALRFLRYCAPLAATLLLACTPVLPISNSTVDTEDTSIKKPELTEHSVDVMIHRSLPQQETEKWAENAISNFINSQFNQANIRHRLLVHQIVTDYDERQGCPLGGTKQGNICDYSDYSKIRLWLYKDGEEGDVPTTSANPESAQIYMTLPISSSGTLLESDWNNIVLAHETGHLFKMPDYYREYISWDHNYVAPIGIDPYIQDIMGTDKYNSFSPTSKGFADKTLELPAGFGLPLWNVQYTPQNTVLKLLDNDGLPMNGVSVEVFPQKWEYEKGPAHPIIPEQSSFIGLTDNNGEFELGNYAKLFDANIYRGISSQSAFLRITNNGRVRYAAITASYLNYLYFQGYEDTALISVPFSSLLLEQKNDKHQYLSAPGVQTR